MPAPFAVITVNWNQTESTCRTLRWLSDFQRLRPELWVVDNASTNGGAETVSMRFPGARLIANRENLGFGAANNQALRAIETPYALLLNNDAHILEEDLEKLLAAMDADPMLAALGPAITAGAGRSAVVAVGGRDISRHIRTHLRPAELSPKALEQNRLIPTQYIPGAIALVRVAALERAGYFEEGYFFGGELADFCDTAAAMGYRSAVLPTARGWHDLGESDEFRRRLYPYYILRNRFLFVRRRRRRLLIPLALLWTAYGLGKAGRELARGEFAQARLLLLAVADGLRGRFGNRNRMILG